MLTIFSAPKPFRDKHIAMIQRNAVRSWVQLRDEVQVILLGHEAGLEQAAAELGVQWIETHTRTPDGTPLLDEIFQSARNAARHPFLCYINADVILLDDFQPTIERIRKRLSKFLIVGTRWDVDVQERLDFEPGWIAGVRAKLELYGKLHSPMGSDYFIYPKEQLQAVPPFALGRAGWDNWMIFHARRMGIPVVDASYAITAVHQNHDYSHLPGGKPHYRHPESDMNIKLAGGRESMFRLRDADWTASPDSLRRKRFADWEWPRKLEADLIARLGPGKGARLVRMLFHPGAAFQYIAAKAGLQRGRGQPSAGGSQEEDAP